VSRQPNVLMRCWLGVLAMCLVPVASSAEVSARVEPPSVIVDESFHVFFEAEGDIRVDPDLSALEGHFEIINQSRDRNVSVVLGGPPVRTSWQLELMPIRTGSFTIPAIDFGSLRSNPVTVSVRPARAAGADGSSHFFLEVEVNERSPYVQQQVLYTARVFRNANTTASRLSVPAPEGVDAVLEHLGKGGNTTNTAIHAGRRYKVSEQRYAIFPQASGTLRIPPLRYQAKVLERGSSRSSTSRSVRTRIIRAQSEAIEIPVLEAPANVPAPWLPARSLRLFDSWQVSGPIPVGATLRHRIAIRATGLTAAQLPELILELPEGLKQYPRQPELTNRVEGDGIMGSRVQTTSLVATRPGTYTLPEVSVTWWNVTTRQAERAVLAPRIIEVTASPETAEVTARADPDAQPPAEPGAGRTVVLWWWLSGALAFAWMLTLWRWRIERRRPASPRTQPQDEPSPSAKQALADLKQSCADHDARAARDALLAWSAAAWPQAPAANLTQLGNRCGEALSIALDDLQRTLYADRPENWDGGQLWEQAKRIDLKMRPPEKVSDPVLEPLYMVRHDKPGRV